MQRRTPGTLIDEFLTDIISGTRLRSNSSALCKKSVRLIVAKASADRSRRLLRDVSRRGAIQWGLCEN